jgi:hypothetical protein
MAHPVRPATPDDAGAVGRLLYDFNPALSSPLLARY